MKTATQSSVSRGIGAAIVWLLAFAPAGAPARQTSADSYGFFAADQNESGGPAYQFVFINETGLKVAGPGDDHSSASPVSEGGINSAVQLAQPFFYYGEEYYTLTPSSNGYLSTDPNDLGDDFSNDANLPAAPDTGGGARLYPLHDDLIISPSGGIYYAYFASGAHPHAAVGGAYHVFQWDNVYHFGGDPERIFDFEVLLFENGDILYQYGLSLDPKADGATIGIQNAAADTGTLFAANDPSALPPLPPGGSLYPSFAILFHAPRMVTNLTDTVPPPFGSLRWAFNTAPDGGTIRFAPSLSGGGTIPLADQFFLAGKTIKITGEDSAGGITLQAAPGRRLFEVDAGATLNLRDIVLTGGRATGASFPANAGGAILCRGIVSGGRVAMTDCQAGGDGGAICNVAASGWLQVGTSSIAGCSAGGRGGAIYSERPIAFHTVSIDSCQSAQAGGGIYQSSPVGPQNQIINSAIRDCQASTFGGGLFLNDGEVIIAETDVTGCSAGQSGGGIYVPGSENHFVAFLNGSISRCAAGSGQGGGVFSGGTFSLAAASLYENTAATDGGGIFNINDATIRYASLYGNGAQRGGGVFNAGASSIEIANSTVAENFASTDGGGLYNAGSLRLISATIAFNQGRSRGGGIYSSGGLFMAASLAAENKAGSAAPDLFGFIGTRDGVNLIGDSSGASGLNASDLRDVDAKLGPLSDYGGGGTYSTLGYVGHLPRLFTVPLLGGSPAIDACPDLTALSLTTDQRGFPRIANGDGASSATEMDIGAWEGLAPIIVNTADDENDPPGSGGPTSLREAIRDTAAPGARILFDPAVFDTPEISTITLAGGPLPMAGRFWLVDATNLTNGVRLEGSEFAIFATGDKVNGVDTAVALFGLAIEHASHNAIRATWDEGSLTVFRCRFSNNGAGLMIPLTNGSAIALPGPAGVTLRESNRILRVIDSRFADNGNRSGSLYGEQTSGLIRSCLFENNRTGAPAPGSSAFIGGGAVLFNDGDNRIARCSFDRNRGGTGGAVFATGGKLAVTDSTFYRNTADWYSGRGGAVSASNCDLSIDRSTFCENRAITVGGAVFAEGPISISHSILAGNSAPSDPDLSAVAGFDAPAPNLIGGDPRLAPLSYYGGDLPTMPPLAGSPALDAGISLPNLPMADQRGLPREIGPAPDIGAAEAGPLIVVNTKDDLRGGGEGKVSLRDAIAAATEPGTRIQFDPAVFTGIGRPGNQIPIDPSLGSIDLAGKHVAIDATNVPGGIQLNGGGVPLSQPFHALFRADARTTLSMHQVEVRETRAQAIWVSPDSLLTLDRCRLTENDGHSMVGGFPGGTALAVQGRAYLIESRIDSNYTSRFGAAVNVWDDGFVSCQNCLFDENFAELEAGAIYAVTQGGVALDLIGCTFLENESAQLDGGAIYLNGCDLRATNSTFAANKAGQGSGGAIFFAPGASAEWSEIVHCTLSTNLCGVRGGALGGSGSIELSISIVAGNDSPLDADLGSGLSVVNPASNLIGGDPQLAPLGDYGGPTPTMPPLPGSPAIDGATDSWEVEDQRGILRENFFRDKQFPDLGAVEYQRAADLALFWNLDWDGDGSPFGAEFAGGTDALAPDRGDPAHPRLTADASGHPGITFGIDSSVASDVAWVVRRSTDLIHFEEIYRFDGRAQSETSAPGIIAVLTPPLSPDRISVFDTNPPSPRAFYRFGAVLLAP